MNIIIPLGGFGKRFKDENYIQQKPFIKILGKSMLQHVLDNLVLHDNDKIYIIYNIDFDKLNFINTTPHKTINFIKLNKQTEGACETVLFGLNTFTEQNLNNKVVLLDCDTFYTTDILSKFRNQTNSNAIFSFKDNQLKPIFSYVNIDDNNFVTEIKEKHKISNIANTGCYCFENGHVLKEYCNKVINNNIRFNNEFYTSCVIDLMIKNNYKFIAYIIEETDFHCVGTPFQLKLYCIDALNNNHNISKLRICFDLDGTLVTFPVKEKDYASVNPIQKNIEYLRYLKNIGHYIIIYTARRMKTHNSNVGKVIKDIGQITLDTLTRFNIPYDEIYFGKPYADYYIDDHAINVNCDLEKELGIYYSKVDERSFNRISTSTMELIIKSGKSNSLQGEIYWYKNIPQCINNLFPKFISDDCNSETDSYTIEKINGIVLSHLFLKESLNEDHFINLLNCIDDIHKSQINNINDNINIYSNYVLKIKNRYNSYNYSVFENSSQIYEKLINFFEKYETNKKGIIGVIHGDPVFSNILVIKNMNFKFIDMRGKLDNTYTIFGDILYDYAKIYQSLIGYDEILLDISVNINYKTKLINCFNTYICEKYNSEILENIKIITDSLLFTLIPLHDNEKCVKYFNLINIKDCV